MSETVIERFHRYVGAVRATSYVEHGISGDQPGHENRVVFDSARRKRRVTLAWQEDASGTAVQWVLEQSTGGEVVETEKGTFPSKDPSLRALTLIERIAPQAPVRTVEPKGRLAAIVFGWTMVLGAAALAKLLAVSTPVSVWERGRFPYSQVVETAQQIANALTLGDLPLIIVGSFVNAPIPGLVVMFGVGLLFVIHALPQIGLAKDIISVRAMAIYLVTCGSAAWLIALVPFPWTLLVGVALAYYAYAVFTMNAVPWQLQRWLRFARDLLISDDAVLPSTLADPTPGTTITLGDGARELEERSLRLRKKIWRKRERAFDDPELNDSYFIARDIRLALGRERRAARRSRDVSVKGFERARRLDSLLLRFRNASLFQGVPLWTALAVLVLVFAPTPWLAPVCGTSGGEAQTIFILPGGNPTFLDDATRKVTVLTSWDGYTLTPGACPS